jgi:ABC-type transport system involved in multi-copper enzyme maturation permease subunit
MSSAIETSAPVERSAQARSWSLWVRQTLAILRLEIWKNFLSRRAILIYLMALLPVGLMALLALLAPQDPEWQNFNELKIGFAAFYGGLVLRTMVFFGCAWIFMNLFRGEIVDRSLHYYFLCPVRREVLVVGKYLSGLLTAIVIFSFTTLTSFLLLYLPRGTTASAQYIFDHGGLNHLLTYMGITVLACIGYGAMFLIIGLFFRNPIIPAILIYGWEWINFLLPPLLKKVSVVHYLRSLEPVPMPEGPFAVLAEPTPAWLSVPGLLILTLIALAFAGFRIRRMEIRYGGE